MDLITTNPDQLGAATGITESTLVPVWEPGGPISKLPARQLLGKLISTQLCKASQAALYADLAWAASSVALVFSDADPAKNGWYRKTGASGAGAWMQFEILSVSVKALAEAAALLARHYANDDTNVDVPGGAAGERGAKYWAGVAAGYAGGLASVPTDIAAQILGLSLTNNLVVVANVTTGTALKVDGTVQGGLPANFFVTNYFSVQPGEILVTNGVSNITGDSAYGWHWYDKAGTRIATSAGIAQFATMVVPANAVQARASFKTEAIAIADLIIRRAIPRFEAPDLKWFRQLVNGVNLYDSTGLGAIAGEALRADGTSTVNGAGYYTTNYFPVLGNVLPVQINAANGAAGVYGWCWYDENFVYISGTVGGASNAQVTPPAAARFGRTWHNVAVANVRIYLGTPPVAPLISLTEAANYASALHNQENLVNPTALIPGSACKTDGTAQAIGDPDFQMTDWFAVNPGETIAANAPNNPSSDQIYGWHFAATPTGAVTGVGGSLEGQAVTVPAGCFYARTFFQVQHRLPSDFKVRRRGKGVGKLSGKSWMHFGDSISAKYNGAFQQLIICNTGLNLLQQDARGGRNMSQIFEMYQVAGAPIDKGNPVTGLSTGGVILPALSQSPGDGAVAPGQIFPSGSAGAWHPNACVFFGYIAGTTLTVTSIVSGVLAVGQTLYAPMQGVITAQITGPAGGLGTYTVANASASGSAGTPAPASAVNTWTSGKTLAQDLAAIDVVTIMLGTNDGVFTGNMGSLASVAADGSYYGWLKWAIEGLLAAKRTLEIIPFIPMYGSSGMSNNTIGDAQRAYYGSLGLDYLDLQRTSGINALTEAAGSALLAADQIHLSARGTWRVSPKMTGHLLKALGGAP